MVRQQKLKLKMAEEGPDDCSRPRKPRKRPAVECGHCGEIVSKSTYYRHKQLQKQLQSCGTDSESGNSDIMEGAGDAHEFEWEGPDDGSNGDSEPDAEQSIPPITIDKRSEIFNL